MDPAAGVPEADVPEAGYPEAGYPEAGYPATACRMTSNTLLLFPFVILRVVAESSFLRVVSQARLS